MEWSNRLATSLFEYQADWIRDDEVVYYAVSGSENFLLCKGKWLSVYDPPEFRLISQELGQEWQSLGRFSKLPPKWVMT